MAKKENILVLCSHSDDHVFGPGATLAKYANQKKKVYTVVFSYGENGIPLMKPEIAKKIREKEAKKADKVLGAKGVFFFDLKEGKFKEGIIKQGITKELVKIIKKIKPSKIFTHHLDDPHPDHKAVYNAVMDAVHKSRYKCDVYLFDVWNPFNFRKTHLPKLYEDVTYTLKTKIDALKCFKSQQISLLVLAWSVYVRAIIHGFHIHKKYAERFFKIK